MRFCPFCSAAFLATVTSIVLLPAAHAQTASPSDTPDAAMMARLRDEEMNHSQVMATVSYLTDVIGPRLTGSVSQKHATVWTRDTLAGWGLANAHVETWGPFGKGWDLIRFSAQVTEPTAIPLIAAPKAWSPGLKKPLEAEAVFLDVKTPEDLAAYKGKLKGKAVLTAPLRPIAAHFEAPGSRYTDTDLAKLAEPPAPGDGPRRRQGGGPGGPAAFQAALRLAGVVNQFLKDEGAALVVDSSRGDGGMFFVQSASAMYGPDAPRESRHSVWEKDIPDGLLPQIVVSSEQYNRIVRTLQANQPVKIAVDLQVHFSDADRDGMIGNTIAELPGTDKAGEIVMCGAHLDSWHGATGATDNAAGAAVCMEALRLLKTVGVHPRRTIRIGLWTGEEEGLFGSTAYVAKHFGTVEKPLPESQTFSAYFNLDNGTGKVRGVWGQGNTAVLPIFAEWLKPFADLGAATVTLRNTGFHRSYPVRPCGSARFPVHSGHD